MRPTALAATILGAGGTCTFYWNGSPGAGCARSIGRPGGRADVDPGHPFARPGSEPDMDKHTLGLLVGGLLPAVLFGLTGVVQATSARAGIGTGPFLVVV